MQFAARKYKEKPQKQMSICKRFSDSSKEFNSKHHPYLVTIEEALFNLVTCKSRGDQIASDKKMGKNPVIKQQSKIIDLRKSARGLVTRKSWVDQIASDKKME